MQPQWGGDFLVEESADAAAGDSAYDLADEVAEGDGAVGERRAGLPQRVGRGQGRDAALPVDEVLGDVVLGREREGDPTPTRPAPFVRLLVYIRNPGR